MKYSTKLSRNAVFVAENILLKTQQLFHLGVCRQPWKGFRCPDTTARRIEFQLRATPRLSASQQEWAYLAVVNRYPPGTYMVVSIDRAPRVLVNLTSLRYLLYSRGAVGQSVGVGSTTQSCCLLFWLHGGSEVRRAISPAFRAVPRSLHRQTDPRTGSTARTGRACRDRQFPW